MIHRRVGRRSFLREGAALAASITLPFDRVFAQAASELPTIAIPPAITAAERLQRLTKARALMALPRYQKAVEANPRMMMRIAAANPSLR